jgi:hypothetical protein
MQCYSFYHSLRLCGIVISFVVALSAQAQTGNRYEAILNKGKVTAQLPEYPGAFRNPMKGFREFFYPGVDKIRKTYPYPYGSMIKEYMQWNMIENKSTDGVDKIIAYSNHRWKGVEAINMKVIPRVYLVWLEPWHGGRPKKADQQDDLGGWHWPADIPPQKSPYKQIPGSWGAYVDSADQYMPIEGGYFDASFPERVKTLVKKLGIAWDNDPRVAYIEMGIIGEWGEHHDPDLSTYWPPHDEPEHITNRTWIPGMEKVLGDAFSEAFRNKKVMVRYAYEFKDYQFGIYWDSWSQPEEQVRGYDEMHKLGDRWKTQPIGGEITWNWGSLAKFRSFEEVVTDKEYFNLTLKQIRNLHCNHLGGITWANFDNPGFKEAAAALQKAMGYRFVLSETSYPSRIETNKPFTLAFSVTNTGSSPFYYQWPVQVSLLNANTRKPVWSQPISNADITGWMPGDDWNETKQVYNIQPDVIKVQQTFTIKKREIPKGKYILALSIADPAGMLPSIRFANSNYFIGGYHPVGYIGVDRNITGFKIDDHLFYDIQSDSTLHY